MLKATANWLAQVDYDIATAEQMLHAGRYIYVIFMSHMALEKAWKALVTEETQQLPPRTHNLIDLAQRARVVLSQEQQDFLGKINNTSVVVRYPDDLSAMVSQYPEAIARDYLDEDEGVDSVGTPRPETTDIIARYCAQLSAMGIHVDRAILFGSHARGEPQDGSDIDVLIVSSDFETLNTRERMEQLGTAAARLWQPIEAIACTPAELVHVEPTTLLEEILQTGVQVS